MSVGELKLGGTRCEILVGLFDSKSPNISDIE